MSHQEVVKSKVCLVTVTYGQRLSYVLAALESAIKEGVHHAVIIDNGSLEPIEVAVRKRFGNWVSIKRLNSNRGSAPGFKCGIQLASEMDCDLILLLDDDNALSPGALGVLLDARSKLAAAHGDSNCMVLAFRHGHQPYESIGQNNGFLGFHVKELPTKISKRLLAWQPKPSPKTFLPYAPYSGLLFHSEVIHKHGLPDERFVLYADDLEFTHRVVAEGGSILLVKDSILVENEISWHIRDQTRSFVEHLVFSESDTAIFYSIRNRCYFESRKRNHNHVIRRINKCVFESLLWVVCLCRRRLGRWQLISNAIADGEQGVLGASRYRGTELM